jgi:hypothetical protein
MFQRNSMKLDSKLVEIKGKLKALSGRLIEKFDEIHQVGVPSQAEKIVIWTPLGDRYNLSFTYMTSEAKEIEGYYPHLSALDSDLENLMKGVDFSDCEYLQELSRLIDLAVAEWLRDSIGNSAFATVGLHKVLAINNACTYFDLKTLEVLEDEEMWV